MSILHDIIAHKRTELEHLPPTDTAALRAAMAQRGGARDFAKALRKPRSGDVALIAEVKKASPSAGVIRADFDPVRIAREYEAAGATCLSVLTDEKYFQGSLTFLRAIRQAVALPLLRKDFIVDERQLAESIEWGADAVLLIAAALDDDQLAKLYVMATRAGLAVLVEVHDEIELARAQGVGATLIGVNNRDLKTFAVDLAVSERLAAQMNLGRTLLVAESGIRSRADVMRLCAAGARAVLVGESLMRQPDIAAHARELLGVA
ncbi:MAG: indole-3-glycerol phosphate synthase TrpC [Pedosphaera sp.]|nr:indole-3-glycerol phosphate synthase TrpC [Pedosphaera sp.]MSU43341.1 indole-3-glycerol phosphate synthase TrpC [Pedosphaera sp.]